MIKRCLFFSIIFLLALLNSRAQSLSLKENSPETARNLSIGGTVMGFDLYNPNVNGFSEAKLTYRFKNELGFVRANYSIAWLDRIEEETRDSYNVGIPANGTQALRNMEAQFGWNFKKKEEIRIASKRFAGRTKATKIPVRFLKAYGLHVGYGNFRTIIAQGSTTSYSGIVEGLPNEIPRTIDATPMLRMKMAHIGIHRYVVSDYVLTEREGSSNKEVVGKYAHYLYADIFYAFNMQFDDLLVPLNGDGPNAAPISNSYTPAFNYYAMNINNSYHKIPIGGRIGYEQTILRSVGLLYGLELGFRPGIFNPNYNMSIMLKIGFTFNAKLK